MDILGIDIGGSGIKGAIVDTKTGELKSDKIRLGTPKPATYEKSFRVIKALIHEFEWKGFVGCGFPGVIIKQRVMTAANLDNSWINIKLSKMIQKETGCKSWVLNDADAAGYAEMKLGAGKKEKGTGLLITVGTGLGSVLFANHELLPNTELGHIVMHNQAAETWASDAARKREDLSWEEWGGRFNEYLNYLHRLFWPSKIVIGGGVAKKMEKFINFLDLPCEVIPAKFLNEAGIIGAALAAKHNIKKS